ncbi:MAG TPA: ATP-binding protein [Puia sp.]|jgi:hypothetical protein
MFIEFSFANFRSINKIQSISFRATALISEDRNKAIDENNIIEIADNKLLKTIGMYGPNGSGKTNVIEALQLFKQMISSSLRIEDLSSELLDPFKLTDEQQENAGLFQAVFLVEKKKFRYGFTLDLNGAILEEWLFGPAEKNETYYFKRRKGNFIENNPERFSEGLNIPFNKLRPDVLFLTFCSSYNGPVSQSIREFFVSNVTVDSGMIGRRLSTRRLDQNKSTNHLIESGQKELILNWMKEVGLYYIDVELDDESPVTDVYFTKNIYNKKGVIAGTTKMSLQDNESDGTKKYYSYIGVLNAIFERGGIYVCDEIDDDFHPSLLQKIIKLFNNPDVNRSNAQLFFTSHDTNLMDPQILRRDQFYFTEKSAMDETTIYALSDLKGIRNNADFARQYLAGFYGALPVLGNYLEEKDTDK